MRYNLDLQKISKVIWVAETERLLDLEVAKYYLSFVAHFVLLWRSNQMIQGKNVETLVVVYQPSKFKSSSISES